MFLQPSNAYLFESASVEYSIDGVCIIDNQTITLDEVEMSAIFNIVAGHPQIAISYRILGTSIGYLPYNLSKTLLFMTDSEISDMKINGTTIDEVEEVNPYFPWYGLLVYKVTLQDSKFIYTFTWDKYLKIMFQMTIEEKGVINHKMTIQYSDSDLDLYESYDESRVLTIKAVKFLTSPSGIIMIALVIILVIIFISILNKYKKKWNVNLRDILTSKSRLKKQRYQRRVHW